jgi:DNA modification methylase
LSNRNGLDLLPESSIELSDSGGAELFTNVAATCRKPGSGFDLDDRRIENVAVSRLTPYQGNARTHSKKQVRQIANSIKRFGFNNPVLVDHAGQIIAGHGRVEAAKLLGLKVVPTLRLSHLSDVEKRAYVLADNKLAQKAGWDREILAIEIKALIDLDFEVDLTGFEAPEIDILLDDDAEASGTPGPDEVIPEPRQGNAVSQVGDLWLLGAHRVLCANALDAAAYETLMSGERAEMVFTDPPYNVPIDGHVSGLGRVRHREFAMATGEMSEADFTEFLQKAFRELAANSAEGAIHFICMDWRHMWETLSAGRSIYSELKNLAVWNKTNGGMGTFYRSKHELVFVWKSGNAPHVNNFELGQHGRYRTNVWDYAGVNTMRAGRMEELAMHPTVKPVAMVADAIRDCSRRKGIILDSFLGSGTTLMAAERTGRRAHCIELDPGYIDVAIRRWQTYTGKAAQLADTGRSFEEVEDQRRSQVPPPEAAHSGAIEKLAA